MGTNQRIIKSDKLIKFFGIILDLLEYFIILAVMLECNSMYTVKAELNSYTDMTTYFDKLVKVLLIITIGNHFILNMEKYKNCVRDVLLVLVIELYASIFFVLNVMKTGNVWQEQNYIRVFLVIFPMFIILFKIKKSEGKPFDLFFKHSDIIFVLSGMGLIIYISTIINNGMIPSDMVYTTWSDLGRLNIRYNFYNIIIFHNSSPWSIGNIALLRNFGPFVEPLMYSIPIIVALFTEMFLREEQNIFCYFKSILFSVVIFTTQSTLCMMIAAVAWAIFVSRICIKKKKFIYLVPILVIVMVVVAFVFLEKTNVNYENVGNRSIHDHVEDFILGGKAFIHKPLLGGGYCNSDYIRTFMSEERFESNKGFSNSVAIILGEGGIMLGLLCMIPFAVFLLQCKKRNNRMLALWGLGPLGLYVGTIWLYHIFLIMIMAFGYSMLELNDNRRIVLCDYGNDYGENRLGKKYIYLLLTFIVFGGLLALFGKPIWSVLYYVLRTNGWSIGISAIKAFLFTAIAMFNCYIIWNSFYKKNLSKNWIISVGLCDFVYFFSYKCVYSIINTRLWMKGIWIEENESLILFFLYFVLFFVLLGSLNILNSSRILKEKVQYTSILIIVTLLICATCKISWNDDVKNTRAQTDVVKVLVDNSIGKVFVDENPALFHFANSGISFSGTKGDGFNAYEDVSVVYKMGTDLKKMFDAGFSVTALSDDYVVYSNDKVAMQNMENLGYEWYRYYPYEQMVNLGDLSWRNGLSILESGNLLIEGQEKSLIYGPYLYLEAGKYNVKYELHIDKNVYAEIDSETEIATARLSYYYGASVAATRIIKLSDFDENGDLVVNMSYYLGGLTEGNEFLLFAKEWYPIEISSISLKEIPEYITVTTQNGYGNPIYVECYNLDGSPYVDSAGISQRERDYDLRGRIKKISYYDSEGNRTVDNSGISGVSYEYDKHDGIVSETYYDVDDNVAENSAGVAEIRYVYDGYGNRIETTYYDSNGSSVITKNGYAILKREYDERRRIIREEYYDNNSQLICIPAGGAGFERKYDEKGNIIEEIYFGADGNPVKINGGYAKIVKEYDDNRRVIHEEYYDTEGKLVAISGGKAVVDREYDEVGNVTLEKYYGVNNEPILFNEAYHEIVKKYNSSNQTVRVEYYGTDYKLISLAQNQAVVEYEYDEAGNRIIDRYLGVNGEPVLYDNQYWYVKKTYDEKKQCIKEEYFGPDNAPIVLSDGACGYRREYDDAGNVILKEYLGVDGKPTTNTSGYAILYRAYDVKKQIIREEYHDESDKLIALSKGQAAVEYEYDDEGNRNVIRYYDASNAPVIYNGQYWKNEITYNDLKQNICDMYYGTDGNLIQLSDGAFGYAREYDQNGNVTKLTYLGMDGKPVLNVSGYAICCRSYNELKQLVREDYYGLDGNPIALSGGQGATLYEYDEKGNKIVVRYYDVNNQPVLLGGVYGYVKLSYNEDNKVTKKTYYNLQDEIVSEEVVE